MTYNITELLSILTSGSSLRDLAMADPREIEARLAANHIACDADMVEYIEMTACDLAAELAEARDNYAMARRLDGRTAEMLNQLWDIIKRRERQRQLFEWKAYQRAKDLGV